MSDNEAELAVCLGRLLDTLSREDKSGAPADPGFEHAREEAARALIQHRIRTGFAWRPRAGQVSFFEQWRQMASRRRDGEAGEAAVELR